MAQASVINSGKIHHSRLLPTHSSFNHFISSERHAPTPRPLADGRLHLFTRPLRSFTLHVRGRLGSARQTRSRESSRGSGGVGASGVGCALPRCHPAFPRTVYHKTPPSLPALINTSQTGRCQILPTVTLTIQHPAEEEVEDGRGHDVIVGHAGGQSKPEKIMSTFVEFVHSAL